MDFFFGFLIALLIAAAITAISAQVGEEHHFNGQCKAAGGVVRSINGDGDQACFVDGKLTVF